MPGKIKSCSDVLTGLLICQCILFHTTRAADQTDTTRLRSKILQNYDIHSRPIQKHNDTTTVEISFYFNGYEINERLNRMTLHLASVMSWEDQHVEWDPLSYGNISETTFTSRELWTPDFTVLNNIEDSETSIFGSSSLMVAQHDSKIWWIPYSKFRASCIFDFTLWPYDSQSCKVFLASWSHYGEEIDMKLRANISQLLINDDVLEHNSENREWKVLKTNVSRKFRILRCCPEISIVRIEIQVDFARNSLSHTAAVTIVGVGIATAILLSFWLDPFAQERIPVTLLLLFMNSMFLQYLHKTIPNNGSKVPLSIRFFHDSLIMVTAAFAWTVGMRYITKIERDIPLPSFVLRFLNSCAGKVLCLNPPSKSKGHQGTEWNTTDGDASELMGETSLRQDWGWLARVLDRIAFIAYVIIYTIFCAAFL